jgi:hypothetical protein
MFIGSMSKEEHHVILLYPVYELSRPVAKKMRRIKPGCQTERDGRFVNRWNIKRGANC